VDGPITLTSPLREICSPVKVREHLIDDLAEDVEDLPISSSR